MSARIVVYAGKVEGGECVPAPQAVAIDAANGMSLHVQDNGRAITCRIVNQGALDKTVTFLRRRPAQASAQDLTVTVPKESTSVVALEGARHMQWDQTIQVDCQAGLAGTIEVLQSPNSYPERPWRAGDILT